ncbi:PepSY domain-containing protein [Sporosarcina sp.]|uniref:PepSY domain-containing protein n=1 Tax=Sporosarcina sp. TaxID=49982 RepID=UPI00261D91E8|nr:PepSY domain-containing protein [Sporosarcina sp.]
MNKWMVFPALAGVLTIGGAATAKSSPVTEPIEEPVLSYEEISVIAQQHAPGEVTVVELDREQGRVVYDIELQDPTIQTDMEVDAQTGDVLKIKKEAAGVEPEKEIQQTASFDQPTEQPASTNHTLTVVSSSDDKPARPLLTKKQAIEIAKQHVIGRVKNIDIEKEKEDGMIFFEIELEDEFFEYEILMDAHSGDIISFEND